MNSVFNKRSSCAMTVMALAAAAPHTLAAVNVFLDFNAGWATELNQATADAGVPDFSAAERALIEGNILAQTQAVYAGYQINFTTTAPGGVFDTVNFGTDETVTDAGTLGFAPLQVGNFKTGDEINMVPRNFAFFISPNDGDPNDVGITRAQQIEQISRGFSGTVSHELGHSLGLNHHQAYADPGITPANYTNTNNLQNQHIIATGATGLDDINFDLGRESVRGFNRWERAMFDITGGFTTTPGLAGQSIVNNPILEAVEIGDAGDAFPTATPITFAAGETSGMQLSLRSGDLDDVANDIDFYSFTVASAGSLMAELFSISIEEGSYNPFDGALTLYDTDGTTILANSDDLFYEGNNFLNGSATALSFDPFLVNIPLLSAGTYYLSIEALADNAVGDQYSLLTGFVPIPEPATATALALTGLALLRRRAA